MEALMGGGTHSYSIFHPAIPPLLQMGQKENAIAHGLFDSPGNCRGPEGMRLLVIQIILGPLPTHPPPSFFPPLICINPKQAACGVKNIPGHM